MKEAYPQKAVFFDRDGTLIVNVPYNGDPEKVTLMPGAVEACRMLHEAGFCLFIISNQSGVGRGLITEEQVTLVNERTLDLLGRELFTAVYYCLDDPNRPISGCRKPSPIMLLTAHKEYGIDLQASFMVGDKEEDVQAGRAAGCRTVRLIQDDGESAADFTASNLSEAVQWILSIG